MELKEYQKKLANLDINEQKLRDLYLRDLSLGNIQGPPTGYASIDKPWLKYYPAEGIKMPIPKKKIYDFIYENNKNNLNDVCLKYFNKSITYQELFENIEKVAKAFKQIGVKKGDIVTMAMATTPEMIYIVYALNRIGAIVNAIDPRLKEKDFKEKINSTNSKYFVGLDMCTSIISNIKEIDLIKNISVSPIQSLSPIIKTISKLKKHPSNKNNDKNILVWDEFIKNGQNYCSNVDSIYEENQPIVILYTGGTTGTPKGVLLTNENFNTMAMTQKISEYDIKRGDTFLTFLPPFSAYCLVNAIHDPLYLGFTTTLLPTFEPKDFPKLLIKYKPNHVLSGPILWEFLINDKKYNKKDLSFLKSPISGGDSMNSELEKRINEHFKNKNCKYRIAQGYGMTEVGAAACYSKEESYNLGSVGIPYIKNIVSVFDTESHEELQYDKQGEICIYAPTTMLKYYNNLEETNKVLQIHNDGKIWVHTGDIGKITKNGNVFIEGRLKRMIVRNGNKIFPSNIESLIMSNEAVANCVIVPMQNDKERNVPIAYVVLKNRFQNYENEIVPILDELIKSQMPDFNIPYKYVFKSELPLTTMNKVNYKALEIESQKYINLQEKIITQDVSLEKNKNLIKS